MRWTPETSSRSRVGGVLRAIAVLFAGQATAQAVAEDWGAYAIVPASAPALVLEAVGGEVAEGTLVSIGKPSGSANQKWVITPKGEHSYSVSPSRSAALVLAAARGGTKPGTPIVLESDDNQPWQRWSLTKNADGSYCLFPNHVQGMGLDHLGGNPVPGAKIDLWTHNPGDRHLRWFIKPLAGSPSTGVGSIPETPPSTYTPPAVRPEDLRRGRVENFTFAASKIFPGTARQVSVFIPAQYNGSTPACVYVKFDGYNAVEKNLLEQMIAAKEMPTTVGVFVRPGELPPTIKGTLGRRNRDFEYDAMGDDNVRFLVEELLPDVAKRFDLKLSTSGNDRCIAGGSSGGIAAFNAAWERPEAFSRVYANSGSFVAFRGGHEFPALVRKFEARPIRAYLTTGMRDMENAAGDWFLLDLEMDKALKFSGYDYSFRVVNGGHVAGYYDYFREAMSYLWKDWPKPIQAGPSAPRVRDLILPDEPWRLVAGGLNDVRAVAFNERGEVFFGDDSGRKVRRIGVDGTISDFLSDAGLVDGLTFGPKGDLFTVSTRSGRVMKFDPTGRGSLVVEGLHGRHVLATPGGHLYVTGWAALGGSEDLWLVKEASKTRIVSDLKSPSGLADRPDRWLLSVADRDSKWVHSYQINPDGSLTNQQRFSWLHVPDWEDSTDAEAVCYAREGPMLVATNFGIQACADDGPTQAILPLPDRSRPIGLCFGGRDLDTLFAVCGDRIYSRKLRVHGVGAFTPWTAVRGSKL